MLQKNLLSTRLSAISTPLIIILICAIFYPLAFYKSATLPLTLLAVCGAACLATRRCRWNPFAAVCILYLLYIILTDWLLFPQLSGFAFSRKAFFAFIAGAALYSSTSEKNAPWFFACAPVSMIFAALCTAIIWICQPEFRQVLSTGDRLQFFARHPNNYATIPAVMLVMALSHMLYGVSAPPVTANKFGRCMARLFGVLTCKTALLCSALAAFVLLLLTLSRTPLFAASLVCLVMLATAAVRRWGALKSIQLAAVLSVLACGLWHIAPLSPELRNTWQHRFISATSNPLAVSTLQSRIPAWESSAANWKTAPWLGHGPESFQQLHVAYVQTHYDKLVQRFGKTLVDEDTIKLPHAHNQYAQFLVEQGIIGLVLFLGLFAGAFWFWLNYKSTFGAGMPMLCFYLLCFLTDSPLHGNQTAAMGSISIFLLLGYLACMRAQPSSSSA